MHLYQYLPGKFKATSTSPPKKLDIIDHKTATTAKSSVLTPRHKNVSVKPHNHDVPNPPPKLKADALKQVAAAIKARKESSKPTTRKESPPPPTKKESSFPMNVGLEFSEESVMSEVTTPTVLTYPKIGPGYSDCISVTSDLTIPTVMPGGSPFEGKQPESLLDMPKPYQQQQQQQRSRSRAISQPPATQPPTISERAKSAPPTKRRNTITDLRINFGDGIKPRSGRGEKQLKRKSSSKKRSRSKKSNKQHILVPDKELTDRLDRLRLKSISGNTPNDHQGEAAGDMRQDPSTPSRLGGLSTTPRNSNHALDDPASSPTSPARNASKKMEEILWTTVQQLLDQQYEGDFEEDSPRRRRQCRSSSPTRKARH